MPLKSWALVDMAGIGDLAKKYGVIPATVCNWAKRYDDFPEPLITISVGPIYSFKQVAKWHRTKRWKAGKHA